MTKKEREEVNDTVAVKAFGDVEMIQRQHEILTADLNAHMARYSEINKEQKAALNRELDLPEHSMLSITHAARIYRDSSEAFELVLSHLVGVYKDYIDNIEISTDINKLSEKYGARIEKFEHQLILAANLRGIHIQKIQILSDQVTQLSSALRQCEEEKAKLFSRVVVTKDNFLSKPTATAEDGEPQNQEVSTDPNNMPVGMPIDENIDTTIEELPTETTKDSSEEVITETNPEKISNSSKQKNDSQQPRKRGRPRKYDYSNSNK